MSFVLINYNNHSFQKLEKIDLYSHFEHVRPCDKNLYILVMVKFGSVQIQSDNKANHPFSLSLIDSLSADISLSEF